MKNLKFKRYNVGDSFEPTTAEKNTIHLVPVSTEPLTVKAYDVDEYGNVAEISSDGWGENEELILGELEKYKLKYNDNANTVAENILNFVDKNTGENVTYRQTTTWHDGSNINDSKLDGVIYKKIGNKYYQRQFTEFVNIDWFGAVGDGITDDSEAIQKCFLIADKLRLSVSATGYKKYAVYSTIFIPQQFEWNMKSKYYDFKGATFLSKEDITVFEQGYYDGNGTLISQKGTSNDYRYSMGVKFGNFTIEYEGDGIPVNYAIYLKDWHQGSEVRNISIRGYAAALCDHNSYYATFKDIRTTGVKVNNVARFKFTGAHNLNVFENLVAVDSYIGYQFEVLTATTLKSMSVEGVTIGLYFTSEVYNCNFVDSYLENWTDVAFKFDDYVDAFTIGNNYFNPISGDGTPHPNAKVFEYKPLPKNSIIILPTNYFQSFADMNDFIVKNKENDYGNGIIIGLKKDGGQSSVSELFQPNLGAKATVEQLRSFTNDSWVAKIPNKVSGKQPAVYSGKYTEGYNYLSGAFRDDTSPANFVRLKTGIYHNWTQLVYINIAVVLQNGTTNYYKGLFIGNAFFEFSSTGISVSTKLQQEPQGDGTIHYLRDSFEEADIVNITGEVRLI